MKLDLLVRPLLFFVGLIFLHKKLRSCQAEFVDALLHIPHHEHVGLPVPLPGDQADQRFLDLVAVLVLVHQDLLVKLCQLVGRRAGAVVPGTGSEDIQGKVLQIIEIHQVFLLLGLLEPGRKLLCQLQEHEDRLPAV